MKICCLVAAIALLGFVAATGQASDRLTTISGKTYIGQVTQVTPVKLVVERNDVSEEIPSIQVQRVDFEGEPLALRTVRGHLAKAEIQDAAAVLERIEFKTAPRKVVQQDYDFYRAYCAAKLALSGEGEIKEAGPKMLAWVNANPTSYHYYEACQILGDLLLALHRYDQASVYYGKLADSPFPEMKMRAGVATGRALLIEKKAAEAQKAFDGVLAVNAAGDQADLQRLCATLGKARCAVEAGNPDDAIKTVEDIVAKTESDNAEVMATAYNTLGAAYKKAGKNKEALMAYLHVEVLYASSADAHAEALANLIDLWTAMGQPDRANKARRTLKEEYKNSPWAAE